MTTEEKLLKAFEEFKPHINGHDTAMALFFEGIKEVKAMEQYATQKPPTDEIRKAFRAGINATDKFAKQKGFPTTDIEYVERAYNSTNKWAINPEKE